LPYVGLLQHQSFSIYLDVIETLQRGTECDTDTPTPNINFGYAHSYIQASDPLWTNGHICRLNLGFLNLFLCLLLRF